MSEPRWMIYGANGYTGELISRKAVQRGLKPILAGRNSNQITEPANTLHLESRVFSLDDSAAVENQLAGCQLVLHCAGPFCETSEVMVESCLKTQTHYLDLTGEIDVLERIHQYHHEHAREQKIVLVPGVGFDVAPTDCLALKLKEQLPDATSLILVIEAQGGISRGTAKTMLKIFQSSGKIRKDGEIQSVPFAYKTIKVPFFENKHCVSLPFGDISTAYYSTGIANIETFAATSPPQFALIRVLRLSIPLLKLKPVQRVFGYGIDRGAPGPSAKTRTHSRSIIWGKVQNNKGDSQCLSLVTANGYAVTIQVALGAVEKILREPPTDFGAKTPAQLMGADFIATLPNTEFQRG